MENIDYDLRSVQEVRDLVRLGQIAQEQIANYNADQIDRIIRNMVRVAEENAVSLAQMAVEETGFGKVADKTYKNHMASTLLYDAIKDINDSKYSGYNTRNPIIVFNGSVKTAVDSISSIGKQQIEKQLKAEIYKKYAEDLVKAYAPVGAAVIGVGYASKLAIDALTEKANLEYVKKYRKEHPKSELSAKEIIRTRHK